MKKIIKLIAAILSFPFLAFSQWTAISPLDNEIMIESNNHENIILTKYFDTVSFSDWKRDLKLNGLLDQGFTGLDFNKLDLIDSSELSQAYEAACVGCWLKWPASPQATIEFPEMNFLYRGYDNVFKLSANWPDGVKEYRIEATDATVKTVTRRNQLMHTINPKGKVSEVKVIYKDAEGFEKEFGPWTYGVRMMPKPIITTMFISKSNGGKINVAMPSDFILGSSFNITKLEFNGTTVEQNNITPDMLKKIKVGKYVPLIVTAINLTTEDEVVINGSIQVTD
jgi:hypothetical protein